MTKFELLLPIVAKIRSHNIGGAFNATAFPTPNEVITETDLKGRESRVEISLPFQKGITLNERRVARDGKNYVLGIYSSKLEMPEKCVICNREAESYLVIESTLSKMYFSHKLSISAPNADRLWTSMAGDRFWYTIPVCKRHNDKNLIKKSITFDTEENKGNLLIKVPNLIWAKKFVELNKVTYANYKDKEFFQKNLIRDTFFWIGFFFTALGIALGTADSKWGLLFLGIPLLGAGLYLYFTNKFETLVHVVDPKKDIPLLTRVTDELKAFFEIDNFTENIMGAGVGIFILGILSVFVEVNGKSLNTIYGLIITGIGGLVLGLGWIIRKLKGLD